MALFILPNPEHEPRTTIAARRKRKCCSPAREGISLHPCPVVGQRGKDVLPRAGDGSAALYRSPGRDQVGDVDGYLISENEKAGISPVVARCSFRPALQAPLDADDDLNKVGTLNITHQRVKLVTL